MRRRAAAPGGLLALLVASCGESEPPASPSPPTVAGDPPRLLLVTLDTTRADRLGCYGDASAATPCLDGLARRGILYERAWTVTPVTLPSHTSILTGVYPCAHGVRENGAFEVADDARLLSEVLKDAGFATAAFVAAFVLDAKFGLDQGFDVYRGPDTSGVSGKWGVVDRPAGSVAQDAIAFLDGIGPQQSYFLWAHFYDPHHPYQPPGAPEPEPTKAYAREIANCDAELQRILDHVAKRGLDRGLIVAVTADHGESLEEHAESTHGIFVYDATMHVPLVIAPPPPGVAAGTRVTAPVSNVDLAATLLERLGIGREALPAARTPLLPSSDEAADLERALYLESLTPYFAHRQHPLRAVVWKGVKYVSTRRPELYVLEDDPRELTDLATTRPQLRDALAARLEALIAEHPPLRWGSDYENTAADHSALRGLGYAMANTDGDPFGDPELPDPKDRIGDLELKDRIASAMLEGSRMLGLDGRTPAGLTAPELERLRAGGRARLDEAVRLIEQLRAGNPKDPTIDLMESTVMIGLGRYADAATILERVVSAEPRDPNNHYNLSNAYLKSGHAEWAKRELEKSVFLDPRMVWPLRTLLDFTFRERDWPTVAGLLDVLAKCEGQSEADLAEVRKTRGEVQKKLDATGAQPKPPRTFTHEELLPEGVLDRARKSASHEPAEPERGDR